MARKLSRILLGLLPALAAAGCRCENLGASNCASSDRCNAIYVWEADLAKECRGARHFRRCERHEGGKPATDPKKLVRDEDGRHWIADPRELPEAEILEEPADALGWRYCVDAGGAEADGNTSGDAVESS